MHFVSHSLKSSLWDESRTISRIAHTTHTYIHPHRHTHRYIYISKISISGTIHETLLLSNYHMKPGGSGNYLRNICWKFVPSDAWYPSTIFSINHRFFPQHFKDPPIFFSENAFFFFRPTDFNNFVLFGSLFCDSCFLLIFWVFQLYKHVKSWKRSIFDVLFLEKVTNPPS